MAAFWLYPLAVLELTPRLLAHTIRHVMRTAA
jgi:hypothetical protein